MGWGWPREPLLPRAGGRLTRPEGGRLPVLVVVGEAREARHAARVVALQALQQLPQLLLALLLPQQPHLVLLLQPLPTAQGATALTPPSAPPWSLLGVPDPAPLLFLPRELWAQRRRVPKREGPLPKPHCRSRTAQRGRELGGCWDACSHPFIPSGLRPARLLGAVIPASHRGARETSVMIWESDLCKGCLGLLQAKAGTSLSGLL